jgi:hypothetical protein
MNNGGAVTIAMGTNNEINIVSWPVVPQIDFSCSELPPESPSEPLTIGGVNGTRKTGSLIACQGGQRFDLVQYNFTTAGRNYLFSYAALRGGAPLTDFDLMVRHTATFAG